MNYSLGNTLSRGGGSLNADGLSLDLQFATDKTLTARKGPTPVFTRASNATYYGPLISRSGSTIPAIGVLNGRTEWRIGDENGGQRVYYSGDRWAIENIVSGEGESFSAAAGNEFRPEQANWSASGTDAPTTSSTFGIVGSAINEPRFDHATTAPNACLGLLIEESRTNLALQSENHPSATWNKTGLTVASASNTDPAGAATSNLVSEDTSVGLHRLFQSTAYVSGTSYSISVFLKYAGRQFVAVNHPAVASNGTSIFDIQNGTITLSGSSVTSSITAYPNGWYRCVVTGISSTTGGSSHVIQGSTTGGILTGSYTGLNGAAFYIYGSQVEAGSFPTSYIPTTTASVVRSMDLCSITGSTFTGFYNQSEGTLFAQTQKTSTNINAFIVHASANSFANGIDLRYNSVTISAALINTSNVGQIDNNTATVTSGALVKQSVAYKLNDSAYSSNGSSPITDTAVLIPTVSQMNIGTAFNNTLALNGHIASIRYYKKRLANAKLQTLTT